MADDQKPTAEFHEDKFLVLKTADIEHYLNYNQKLEFQDCLRAIKRGREIEKKPGVNKYYVCNRDEPYAEDVIRLILQGAFEQENKG